MSYQVKLDIFEGPLDLLLYLIKKSELDIYNIPIAQITDQYLAYLELMEALDLNVAGEFIVMAATLMQIKSQMLLPPETLPAQEQEEEDPREALVRQLLEYQRFKAAANSLSELAARQQTHFRRPVDGALPVAAEAGEEPFFEASLFDLLTAFSKVLKEIPKETFYQIIKESFTVEEKVQFLRDLVRQQGQVSFHELFGPGRSKLEMIATFLAVLELIRQRAIQARQTDIFGEIVIVPRATPPEAAPSAVGEAPGLGGQGAGV